MSRPGVSPLSVYLVEDSDLLADRMIRVLQDDVGAEVVGRSGDASAAIAEIAAAQPEVVLVDLSLQSGTGFEVLRALQHRGAAPKPLCIVLTNHSSAPYKQAAGQLGVTAERFFDKTEQLCSLVGYLRWLAERRSESLRSTHDAPSERERSERHHPRGRNPQA